MTEKTKLGFIGLGVMGEPMCRNMTKAGLGPMVVFDLSVGPLARLEADGATRAGTIAEVSKSTDIIFLSLPGGPEVEKIILGPGGLLENGRAGQIIVDMSTCPVAIARKAAAALAEKGMIFADAPVARTRQAAIDGTLSIMVGSDDETFETLRPYLAQQHAADPVRCRAG